MAALYFLIGGVSRHTRFSQKPQPVQPCRTNKWTVWAGGVAVNRLGRCDIDVCKENVINVADITHFVSSPLGIAGIFQGRADLIQDGGIVNGGRHLPGFAVGDLLHGAPQDLAGPGLG